jgi:hypothetical protein
MNIKLKKVLLWILAVMISLGTMVYQRMTGPSYPKKYEINVDGESYSFTLPRSNQGRQSDYPVKLELPESFSAKLIWRLYPSESVWDTLEMKREGDILTASLPLQPPAGKIEYHVAVLHKEKALDLHEQFNVVFRFRGDVPAWALIPHVLMMILTVIWSMATIIFVLAKLPHVRTMGITIIFLIIGGFILGPIVQKYSFGQFWTGWPLGEDLTDNKVLAAVIVYLLAWFLRSKSYGKWLAVLAAVVMLAVYLIPHSMNGSELDVESGEVITGGLLLLISKGKLHLKPKI